MTTPFFSVQQLPKTSADAIRVFDERYIAAQAAARPQTWAADLGDVFETDSPDVTFPMSQYMTKYRETQGENRAVTMAEASERVKVVEFDSGYEAKLFDITKNVFAYKGWEQAPATFPVAEDRHVVKNIAALLEAGDSTASWDGVNFFATNHPANLSAPNLGTSSNLQTSVKDVLSIPNLEAEITAMRMVKDRNGDKLGVEPDTIGVPTEKFQALVNLMKQDLIAARAGESATVRNPFYNPANNPGGNGVLTIVHMMDLTDPDDWYLGDSKLIRMLGLPPWVAMRCIVDPALALRYFDESSDFFKDTGKLKVTSHIWWGFKLLFWQAIRKIKGA
jgi:hypothetical protein